LNLNLRRSRIVCVRDEFNQRNSGIGNNVAGVVFQKTITESEGKFGCLLRRYAHVDWRKVMGVQQSDNAAKSHC